MFSPHKHRFTVKDERFEVRRVTRPRSSDMAGGSMLAAAIPSKSTSRANSTPIRHHWRRRNR